MTQTQMPTIAQLTVIGEVICQVFTPEMIRGMHDSAEEGAEILRLIVRDDLGGAAETITNALWDTL